MAFLDSIAFSYRWQYPFTGGISMSVVTVSPKFQVVIPKDVRESANIQPGTKFDILVFDNTIRLIPLVPIESLRGTARGIDTTIVRDKDRL
jgi:AbrB family looped-hinge helix DNA binding protein